MSVSRDGARAVEASRVMKLEPDTLERKTKLENFFLEKFPGSTPQEAEQFALTKLKEEGLV